jgi:CBS-domain-containing membrane protein
MVNQLIDIISREAVVFETFLTLLERQRDLLVTNDVAGLTAVTAQQQESVLESKRLNRERERLVKLLQAEHDLTGDFGLSKLLELVDRSQAERLTQLRDLIFGLNEQITDVRNSNAMLLNNSRKFIAKTMTMLSQLQHPDNTYSRKGTGAAGVNAVAVDRRA